MGANLKLPQIPIMLYMPALLPPKRQLKLRNRGHDYELPIVRTERFKRVFLNICLFNFV